MRRQLVEPIEDDDGAAGIEFLLDPADQLRFAPVRRSPDHALVRRPGAAAVHVAQLDDDRHAVLQVRERHGSRCSASVIASHWVIVVLPDPAMPVSRMRTPSVPRAMTALTARPSVASTFRGSRSVASAPRWVSDGACGGVERTACTRRAPAVDAVRPGD